MTTWFTSDLHLGHERIIELCDRPFRDVDHMNRELIDRWNDRVQADEVVWVLGDVALGKIADTLPLCQKLNGYKVLVAGNHDRCWAGHSKVRPADCQRYVDAGFARIHEGWELPNGAVPTYYSTPPFSLSHFPYRGDSHDEDRYVSWRPIDNGDWLLHGHVHNQWKVNGRQINVGVDVWDYAPVSLETILSIVSDPA